jgi:ATP-dependent Zn protease
LLEEIGGSDGRTEQDLWIEAVHEAGHAVACCELAPGTLSAISLRSVGDSAGVTVARGTRKHYSAFDVRHRLIIRLAGRAAEEVFLGHATAGAGGGAESDLAAATRLATTAAASFGLDPATGLCWLGMPNESDLTGMLKDFPALAARVREVVDEAYLDAVSLIRLRAAAVESLAVVLLQRQALDGEEAEAIVAQNPSGRFEGLQ